ncbi:MAG: NAD-dependent epimerase/dehydratase family protein, partial [Acidobacteriota bacterium]
MNKQKILICGGTGFIGRNLCQHFGGDASYEVSATYRKPEDVPGETEVPGVEWIQADLTLKDDVNRTVQGMDIILQAAATTSGAKDIVHQPYLHVTDNVVMNAYLFRA